MNKVIYVKSFFKPVGETKTVEVATGEKKKGMFGGEKDITRKEEEFEQTGWSDCVIDGERLAADIDKAVQSLNSEGYEVVAVSETLSGEYNYKWASLARQDAAYGYGFGYSYTEGVTIIAKKSV